MKVADIPDQAIFDLIVKAKYPTLGASRWDIQEALGLPENLVLAKMRTMIRKQQVDGCACGCRGDFTFGASHESH